MYRFLHEIVLEPFIKDCIDQAGTNGGKFKFSFLFGTELSKSAFLQKKISWWYPLILLNCQNDCIQIVDSSQVTTFCNNFLLILIFRVNSTCGGGADYHERFSIFSEPAYNNHNGTFNSTIIARSPPAGAKFRSKSQLGGKAFFPL